MWTSSEETYEIKIDREKGEVSLNYGGAGKIIVLTKDYDNEADNGMVM